MSTTSVPTPPLMTTEELLAMPDDGVERWLVRGELREKKNPTTVRSLFQNRIMTRVGKFLDNWLDEQPEPRGWVLCGKVGYRLRQDSDCTYGFDVVYISDQLTEPLTEKTTLIDGVPELIVEILSPNDTKTKTNDKVDSYRAAGVPLVWVIDPHFRTVLIFRRAQEPSLVSFSQELTGESVLPGFRVAVAKLFE